MRYLGKDLQKGEEPQILVPKGVWQGAHMACAGEYTLVSTSMTPAYDEKGFTVIYEADTSHLKEGTL